MVITPWKLSKKRPDRRKLQGSSIQEPTIRPFGQNRVAHMHGFDWTGKLIESLASQGVLQDAKPAQTRTALYRCICGRREHGPEKRSSRVPATDSGLQCRLIDMRSQSRSPGFKNTQDTQKPIRGIEQKGLDFFFEQRIFIAFQGCEWGSPPLFFYAEESRISPRKNVSGGFGRRWCRASWSVYAECTSMWLSVQCYQ